MVNSIDRGASEGHCQITPVSSGDDDAVMHAEIDVHMGPSEPHRDSNGEVSTVTSQEWVRTFVCYVKANHVPKVNSEKLKRLVTI